MDSGATTLGFYPGARVCLPICNNQKTIALLIPPIGHTNMDGMIGNYTKLVHLIGYNPGSVLLQMARQRDQNGQYVETVAPQSVLEVLNRVDGPVITFSDVAEYLDCTTEAARQKLHHLVDRGALDRRKTGRTVLYWSPNPGATTLTNAVQQTSGWSTARRGGTPSPARRPFPRRSTGSTPRVRTSRMAIRERGEEPRRWGGTPTTTPGQPIDLTSWETTVRYEQTPVCRGCCERCCGWNGGMYESRKRVRKYSYWNAD